MPRLKVWTWPALALAGVIAAAGVFFFLRWQRTPSPGELYARIPQDGRVITYIDLGALRAGGILDLLAGGKGPEEPDYRQFVADTGFNYKRDLDQLLMASIKGETHVWLNGRFDYPRLEAYARKQGGACASGICRLSGGTPGRHLSFSRYRAHTIAFASSADPEAVKRLLAEPSALPQPSLPSQPVWFVLPTAVLKDESLLPSGTHTFATALADAQRVTLAIGPRDQRFEALLDVSYQNSDQARQAMRELQAATTLLQRMIAREHKEPNDRDLSGILTKGEFHADGSRLSGKWPIERVFLEGLSAPGTQP
ncbi:MAG: hypothetical protein IT165_11565 [Bryobacterales bacterium]|nr:hypothetical protein [Bryobacterales bacterium]